ncbi:hypothetical protein BKA62DRAFT_684063, partial [Auriculariales sp. MPI-PUGE-AT-0066]
ASQLQTAPLKERIAALQGKAGSGAASSSTAPSRSHSPLPNTGSSSAGSSLPPTTAGAAGLSRAGTVRDRAARFEQKGGMPVPRGAFGMSLPPAFASVDKPQRKGELWGNRLPELGRGGKMVLHSRNVSASYSEVSQGEDDEDHRSYSRSNSPAPGQLRAASNPRRRTASSYGFIGVPFDTTDDDAVDSRKRFTASNPDLHDLHFGHDKRQVDIPPVPPLPPGVQHPPLQAHTDTIQPSTPDETTTGPQAPEVEQFTDAYEPAPPEAVLHGALPVPAVRVEGVEDARLGADTVPQFTPADLSAPVDHTSIDQDDDPDSPLFYSPPAPLPIIRHGLQGSSQRSPPPPALGKHGACCQANERTKPGTPSDILTPSTMDAFPSPPTLSPHASPQASTESRGRTPSPLALPTTAPSQVEVVLPPPVAPVPVSEPAYNIANSHKDEEYEHDCPPPLPPKDDIYTAKRRNGSDSRKLSVDSGSTSEASHAAPITPPATSSIQRAASTKQRAPVVIPNWWEDDEDQQSSGWAKVVSRR